MLNADGQVQFILQSAQNITHSQVVQRHRITVQSQPNVVTTFTLVFTA